MKPIRKPKFKLKSFVPTEGDEQAALFDWAQAMSLRWPQLRLMYAIPNGVPINGPQKWAIINAFKRRGLKAGVPDLCLPVPRGEHHGLYIEMKRADGGVGSDEQRWWYKELWAQGYMVLVAYGCKEATKIIVDYLNLV
jgi:hypothetical protein